MEQVFSGIKMLDLTLHISGPHWSQILAGFGADVGFIFQANR